MSSPDRTLIIRDGELTCETHAGKARVTLPAQFDGAMLALAADLDLALECAAVFGGIPVPVARALLRRLETARTAIDYALRTRQA